MNIENPKLAEHEALRESIGNLEGLLKTRWWITITEVVIFGVFLGGLLYSNFVPVYSAKLSLTIGSLVIFVLIARSYDLAQHNRTKLILQRQKEASDRQRRRTDTLYGLSILDPLTTLHNRRFGEQRLGEELVRSERSGDPLAVVLFDLDHFKSINDRFGHAAGDAVLKEFSRILKRAIRACDVPVRIGGDEFLVVLPDCPNEKVEAIFGRIQLSYVAFARQRITISYSIGRAQYQYGDTIETLLGRADEGLYTAKAARPAEPMLSKPVGTTASYVVAIPQAETTAFIIEEAAGFTRS